MKTYFTLHTDLAGKTLCSSEDGSSWGLLSSDDISDAADRGDTLEEWPSGVWVETHSDSPDFRSMLLELASEKKIECISWDDAGMAFGSLADAKKAIHATVAAILAAIEEDV